MTIRATILRIRAEDATLDGQMPGSGRDSKPTLVRSKDVSANKEKQHNDGRGEDVVDHLDETVEDIPFAYSITSYGADCPVDSLVQRLRYGDITVPTFDRDSSEDAEVVGFQREHLWTKPKADKFIEITPAGFASSRRFSHQRINGAPAGIRWSSAASCPSRILRWCHQRARIPPRQCAGPIQEQGSQGPECSGPSSDRQ